MKPTVFALLIALLFLSPTVSVALETAALTDFPATVRSIAVQDRYLWCATPSGVVRWDTRTMSAVRYTISDGLVSDDIFAVGAFPDGTVLAGTGCRIYKYETLLNRWAEVTTGEGLPGFVTSILIHPQCMYCVGTVNGVCRYTIDSWGVYTTASGLADNRVRQLASSQDGTVWFATAGGVSRYHNEIWKSYTTADGLASNDIRTVSIGADGLIWAGTPSGISLFDGSTWKNFAAGEGLADTDVRVLAASPNKIVWAGTASGMYRFSGISWEKSNDPGAPSEPVNAVVIDPDNTVWAGTDRGLYRYEGTEWTLHTAVSIPTGTGEISKLPVTLSIKGNFPNPFNPETVIEFTLPTESIASIAVYSLTSQRIRTLTSGIMSHGSHTVRWDGRDENGRAVSSGVYIAEVRAGNMFAAHRMMLLR
jgi:hypothetical protein